MSDQPEQLELTEVTGELLPEQAAFLSAFRKTKLNTRQACEYAGVTRKTVNRWIAEHAAFSAEYDECKEGLIDDVESTFMSHIFNSDGKKRTGSLSAIMFFLKTKGKARGYVETQEITDPNRTTEIKIQWGE
jgi:hypothetical protein